MKHSRMVRLEHRFANLWDEVGAKTNYGPIFDKIVRAYNEAHRFYHVLDHVDHNLTELGNFLQANQGHPDFTVYFGPTLKLAHWYHDLVYDTKSASNELNSAKIARTDLIQANVLPVILNGVFRLVNMTAPGSVPKAFDEKVMIDIDLSIFGQHPDVFDKYENDIRREYSWVSEPIFRQKRREILERFRTGGVYYTEYFRDRYEVRAQANLARSIQRLAS